jgi:hypothetical protein
LKNLNIAALALLLVIAVSTAGCGKSKEELKAEAEQKAKAASEEAERAFIEKLKSKVAAQLSDPQSAQFRNIRFNARKDFLCGEINGKNKFGGYVGFMEFTAAEDFDFIVDNSREMQFFMPIVMSDRPVTDDLILKLRKSGCFQSKQ